MGESNKGIDVIMHTLLPFIGIVITYTFQRSPFGVSVLLDHEDKGQRGKSKKDDFFTKSTNSGMTHYIRFQQYQFILGTMYKVQCLKKKEIADQLCRTPLP